MYGLFLDLLSEKNKGLEVYSDPQADGDLKSRVRWQIRKINGFVPIQAKRAIKKHLRRDWPKPYPPEATIQRILAAMFDKCPSLGRIFQSSSYP